MAMTLTILNALEARLKAAFPDLAVEYFPGKPGEYVLAHPKGAVLVRYTETKYQGPVDTTAVVQPATLKFTLIAVSRQITGEDGAVAVLSRLRTTLIGYTPPNCRRKIWAVSEQLLGETTDTWQYALELCTEAMLIGVEDEAPGVLLTRVTTHDSFNQEEFTP